jgi:undecaprenyl-diphosphatase
MEENNQVKKIKGISLRLIIIAGIFLLAFLLFSVIADEMVLENENNLDKVVFRHLAAITYPGMTHIMEAITFFGSSYFLFPAYILLSVYFLFFRKNRRLSMEVVAMGAISTVILFSLKALFHRQRPVDPLVRKVMGFSFPSGHSFCSFTFFGLLIYILWNSEMNNTLRWTLTILFFLLACTVAFSRVYLHVHYASDVIAGFCLCIIWLVPSLWTVRKINKNYHV